MQIALGVAEACGHPAGGNLLLLNIVQDLKTWHVRGDVFLASFFR
jgi:hypothetical protein